MTGLVITLVVLLVLIWYDTNRMVDGIRKQLDLLEDLLEKNK